MRSLARPFAEGMVVGITGATLGAIGVLLLIGGASPGWSLAMFALCIYVVHGLVVFGEYDRTSTRA